MKENVSGSHSVGFYALIEHETCSTPSREHTLMGPGTTLALVDHANPTTPQRKKYPVASQCRKASSVNGASLALRLPITLRR
jgi:hypothetical protein